MRKTGVNGNYFGSEYGNTVPQTVVNGSAWNRIGVIGCPWMRFEGKEEKVLQPDCGEEDWICKDQEAVLGRWFACFGVQVENRTSTIGTVASQMWKLMGG